MIIIASAVTTVTTLTTITISIIITALAASTATTTTTTTAATAAAVNIVSITTSLSTFATAYCCFDLCFDLRLVFSSEIWLSSYSIQETRLHHFHFFVIPGFCFLIPV